MIAQFADLLIKLGFDPSPREIAEALFLAMQITPAAETEAAERTEDVAGKEDAPTPPAGTAPPQVPQSTNPPLQPKTTDNKREGEIYTNQSRSTAARDGLGARGVRVASAIALPGARGIAKALRPLHRQHPSRTQREFDLGRTIDMMAETGLPIPAERAARERWLEAALVVDESETMRVWRPTIREFQKLLERHGAFRDVRVWGMNEAEGEPRLYTGLGRVAPPAKLRDPRELLDAEGRRVILVLSDCHAPIWHRGKAFELLARWGERAPVLLVQLLPQRLWEPTAMPRVDMNLSAESAGLPNARLRHRRKSDSIPMAVATLEEWAFAPWAQMIAARGKAASRGFLIQHPWPQNEIDKDEEVEAKQELDAFAALPEIEQARIRIADFKAAASVPAFRLACYLASVNLNLPVMRLLQQAMMPESRQSHLAEVLLGGLIRPVADSVANASDPDEILYEFYPHVDELLLDPAERHLDPRESLLVASRVSRLIENRMPYASEFRVLLAASDTEATERIAPGRSAIATISPALVRRYFGQQVDEPAPVPPPVTEPSIQQEIPPTLSSALSGALSPDEVHRMVEELGGMTAIDAWRRMRDEDLRWDGEQFFLQGTALPIEAEQRANPVLIDFLKKTQVRCHCVISVEELLAKIPLRGLNSKLLAETEAVRQRLQSAIEGGENPIMLKTDDQRTAALRTSVEFYGRFPDGALWFDSYPTPFSQYTLMQACLLPFVHLKEDVPQNQLLLFNHFSEVFKEKRVIIILDQVEEMREISRLPRLFAGSVILAISQKGKSGRPNRGMLETQLETAFRNFDQVVSELDKIAEIRDLRLRPAPTLITNLETLRKDLLQQIRRFEADLHGLERDPQQRLEELIRIAEREIARIPTPDNHAIDSLIAELRQAESERREAELLIEIGKQFSRGAESLSLAVAFGELALEKEPEDLRLHYDTFRLLESSYFSLHNFGQAGYCLHRAMQNALAEKDLATVTEFQLAYGALYIAQEDWRRAEQVLESAITKCRTIGHDSREKWAAELLKQVQEHLHKPAPNQLPSLTTFSFETITLDDRGRPVKNGRRNLTARRYIEELAPGTGLEMVEIPGGSFLMGTSKADEEKEKSERSRYGGDKEWINAEMPQHEVNIRTFFMGRFAVTQRQWRIVAGLDRIERHLDPEPSHFKDRQDSQHRPVEQVSWQDAKEFCARLSKKTGREYRLPSEAEWEYACRAGTSTPFAFGETITHEIVNYNSQYPSARAKEVKSREMTVAVGSLGFANAFGLYDMHGNVWEWCEDIWHVNYEGAPADGSAWLSVGYLSYRVLRGGSWSYLGYYCRSANRFNSEPDVRNYNVGFRVVVGARVP